MSGALLDRPAAIKISIQRKVCTDCGAEANASCNCGKPYIPAKQRVAEYDKQNPGRSTRQAAADLGVSRETVRATRKEGDNRLSPDTITGRDGKQYPGARVTTDKRDPVVISDVVEKTRQANVAGYLGDGDIVEQALVLVGKMNDGERQRFDAAYSLRFCDATLN
jgi:hypothetical protein